MRGGIVGGVRCLLAVSSYPWPLKPKRTIFRKAIAFCVEPEGLGILVMVINLMNQREELRTENGW
jgi:hypothetical protein